jgi:hypothetical protein
MIKKNLAIVASHGERVNAQSFVKKGKQYPFSAMNNVTIGIFCN